MIHSVEKAFRDVDQTARLLGDMKHSVYALKIKGGISEVDRIRFLAGFLDEAEGYIDLARKQLEIAYEELTNEEQ